MKKTLRVLENKTRFQSTKNYESGLAKKEMLNPAGHLVSTLVSINDHGVRYYIVFVPQ